MPQVCMTESEHQSCGMQLSSKLLVRQLRRSLHPHRRPHPHHPLSSSLSFPQLPHLPPSHSPLHPRQSHHHLRPPHHHPHQQPHHPLPPPLEAFRPRLAALRERVIRAQATRPQPPHAKPPHPHPPAHPLSLLQEACNSRLRPLRKLLHQVTFLNETEINQSSLIIQYCLCSWFACPKCWNQICNQLPHTCSPGRLQARLQAIASTMLGTTLISYPFAC